MTTSLTEHMRAVPAGREGPFEPEPLIYPNQAKSSGSSMVTWTTQPHCAPLVKGTLERVFFATGGVLAPCGPDSLGDSWKSDQDAISFLTSMKTRWWYVHGCGEVSASQMCSQIKPRVRCEGTELGLSLSGTHLQTESIRLLWEGTLRHLS